MTKKIRAVLFDAGGILFDDSPKDTFWNFLRETFKDDKERLERSFGIYDCYRRRSQTTKGYSKGQAYRDTLREMGIMHLYLQLKKALGQGNAPLRMLPNVDKVLKSLKERGIYCIVITDASITSDEFKKKFEEAGFPNLEGIVSSKDVGYCKPDERIFNDALKKYGLKNDEVLFVAHDLDELEGAHRLGIKTLALNYSKNDEPMIGYAKKLSRFEDILTFI